jgi:hypothetical protein
MRALAVISLTLLACSNPAQKPDCRDCRPGLTFVRGPHLPAAIDHHATVIVGGFLYVIGGNDYKKQYSDVWMAPIAKDGSLGTWRTTTSLPGARAGHGVALIGDRIFVISGQAHKTFLSSVLSAAVRPDGTLGNWEAEPDLPAARFHSYVAQSEHFLFVSGGVDAHFDAQKSIYVAPIVNGRLGAFSSAGELPLARSHHAALVHEGSLYIAGGLTGNPTGESHNLKEILRAVIRDDGSLEPFSVIATLDDPPATLSGFERDGAWILVGGLDDGGTYLARALKIPFLKGGALGDSENFGALPVGRSHVHQTPSSGDFVYSIGGSIGLQKLTSAVQIGHVALVPPSASPKRALARVPHCSIQ